MNNDLKKALEEAYCFKKPSRKEEFFKNIHKDNKPVLFYIKALKYSAVPVTAAIAVIIFTGFINSNGNIKNEFVSESGINTTCYNYNDHDSEDFISDTQIVTTVTSTISEIEPTSSLSEKSDYIIYQYNEVQYTYDQIPAATNIKNTTESTDIATTVKTTETTFKITIQTTLTTPGTAFEPSPSAPITTSEEPWQDTVPSTTSPASPAPDDEFTKDMRVKPNVVYKKTDNIIDITYAVSDNKPSNSVSWNDSASKASAVIYGSIENIYYTSVYGEPYIQADILVKYSMRYGDYFYGNRISVYVPGGYMSLSDFISYHKWFESELGDMLDTEINESTAFHDNGNADILLSGSEFLFFLNNGFGDMPDGAFTLCSNMDIYRRSGKRFVCAKDSSISFTAKELEKYFY